MSQCKEVDITGVVCAECGGKEGVAKVAFKPPKRYFWGCSRFPACKGPKAWNWFAVPQAQRDECDALFRASMEDGREEKEVGAKRERARNRVLSDLVITKRVFQVKRMKANVPKVSQRGCVRCVFFFFPVVSRGVLNEKTTDTTNKLSRVSSVNKLQRVLPENLFKFLQTARGRRISDAGAVQSWDSVQPAPPPVRPQTCVPACQRSPRQSEGKTKKF
jgi:ssDNA-binding Zn-finger/Zn-ribbon topoisomerase 1